MRIMRRGAGALSSLLVVGALAACTATPPLAPPPSTSTPTPTVDASRPTFRLGLDCADLVDPKEVAATLHAAATPVDAHTWRGTVALADYAVTQAGGLQCQWAVNPNDYNGGIVSRERSPAPRLIVSLLPDAAAKWTPGYQGDAPASQTRKFGTVTTYASCGDPGCHINALVGTTWVDILIYNPAAQMGETALGGPEETFTAAAPAVSSVFAAITGAGDPAPAWTPPASAAPIAPSCDALLPEENLTVLLRSPSAGYLAGDGGASAAGSQQEAALAQVGALQCAAGDEATTSALQSPLALAAVQGGGWIPAQAKDTLPSGASATSLNLAGLSAPDVAILSCVENRLCTLDFSLHGNLIEVRTQQATVSDLVPARGLAIAAAEAIIRRQAG